MNYKLKGRKVIVEPTRGEVGWCVRVPPYHIFMGLAMLSYVMAGGSGTQIISLLLSGPHHPPYPLLLYIL